MIKRAIGVTVFLLLLYSTFIYFFQSKINRTGQNQYSANIVKAEEFLFEKGAELECLIVGSSMASRIVMDSLPSNYFNLSMGGMSIFDGLSLLSRKVAKPKIVLIEMNMVFRPANLDLEKDMFNPVLNPLRAYVPLFRKKYQPIAVAKAMLRDITGAKPDAAIFKLPDNLYKQELKNVLDRNARRVDSSTLNLRLSDLSKYVYNLQQQGIEIVFFEMPFYDRAMDLPGPVSIRTAFREKFPPAKYNYVPLPSDVYQTSDGVHLASAEAARYTRHLRQQLAVLGY